MAGSTTSATTNRLYKAMTLVPLAMLSCAWTTSVLSGAANADDSRRHPLPDGTKVPSQTVQAPANVQVPGQIAPSVPDGTADQVISGASANGIPAPALSAYQRAAQIIDSADTTCNIPWELVAAIGRVESNHGQYGGNTLSSNGVSSPGIYGPELNGKGGTQAIRDTDSGQLDKDPVWDRAVGAMQFIPSTWQVVKVDADGDGQRNPQDIDDSSLATAVYLCSGNENLSSRAGQQSAVYRYNHSQSYVDLVLRLMEAYSQGDYTTTPAGTPGTTTLFPSNTPYALPSGRGPGSSAKKSHQGTHQTTSPGSPSAPSTPSTPTKPKRPSAPTKPKQPSAPSTPKLPLPTSAPTQVAKPVTDTLSTLAEATAFCQKQLSGMGAPSTAVSKCANKVLGDTTSAAAAAIPNTLTALLNWLGLPLL